MITLPRLSRLSAPMRALPASRMSGTIALSELRHGCGPAAPVPPNPDGADTHDKGRHGPLHRR